MITVIKKVKYFSILILFLFLISTNSKAQNKENTISLSVLNLPKTENIETYTYELILNDSTAIKISTLDTLIHFSFSENLKDTDSILVNIEAIEYIKKGQGTTYCGSFSIPTNSINQTLYEIKWYSKIAIMSYISTTRCYNIKDTYTRNNDFLYRQLLEEQNFYNYTKKPSQFEKAAY